MAKSLLATCIGAINVQESGVAALTGLAPAIRSDIVKVRTSTTAAVLLMPIRYNIGCWRDKGVFVNVS
jgi:hypothetical protein